MLQWEWLGGLPPLRRAAVVGAGAWGTAWPSCSPRGPRGRPRLPHARAGRGARGRARNERYLPGVALPERVERRARRRPRARAPRPRLLRRAGARLPAAVAAHAARSRRAPACSCCPRASCRRSARCRPPSSPSACRRGPSPRSAARRTPTRARARRLARARPPTTRRSPARSATRSRAAGFDVATTTDLIGVELAGCAKNAAALAAAAAAGAARTPRAPPPARCSPRSTRTRATRGAQPGDLRRARRGGRPRRHRPRRRLAQPPRRRDARRRACRRTTSASALGQTAEAVDCRPAARRARSREAGVDAPVAAARSRG